MKIVYVSCMVSKKAYGELFDRVVDKPGQQVQKYHRLLAEGFAKNKTNVVTVSAPPISRSNCRKLMLLRSCETAQGVLYRYVPMINLPLIKNIFTLIFSFFYTMAACHKDKESVVVCDILNISVSAGALFAARLMKRLSLGIVTDLPDLLADAPKKMSVTINKRIMGGFSSYVFLTEQMNERVNKNGKPYVVVEGQVDINMARMDNHLKDKYEKKVCLYAGALHKIYGIQMLVEAFVSLGHPDAELHIYGSGDYENEINAVANKYDNVMFFGVVSNDVVVAEQLKATLLINPRPSYHEFAKYSFPSKNMEYMVSGTPTLTTMLPGMPPEFRNYVYIIENETIDGVRSALTAVLQKNKQELHEKGAKAKEFVLKQKNNIVQTDIILQMIKRSMLER